MEINELAKEIHDNAVAHGWWEDERSVPEIIALCHSELSEALEEYRDNRPMKWYACGESVDGHPCEAKDKFDCFNYGNEDTCRYRDPKPEGIAAELCDCVIRIFDFLAKENIDIEALLIEKHEYNKTRPYKHGGKRA